MLAPLLPVTSVAALSRPAVPAASTASAPLDPGTAGFSDVLAAERAGGEKLPQAQATGSPEINGGKSLPGAEDNPASTDVTASAATGAGVAAEMHVRNAEVDARASAQIPRELGLAVGSLQAQARAAEGSAVISGVPAKAVTTDIPSGAADLPLEFASSTEYEGSAEQANAFLLPPSPVVSTSAQQDGRGTQIRVVPQLSAQTESEGISIDALDADIAAAIPVPVAATKTVDVASAVASNVAAMADAAPADIQALMGAIQRDLGQSLPPAVLRALEAQQSRQIQSFEQRLGVVPASTATSAEPVLASLAARMPGAEQAPVLLSVADAIARLSATDAGVDARGEDSALQAGMLRTGIEGGRAAQSLNPLPAQLPSMPPGLSPGLSQGNAAWGQAISERVLLMTAGSLQVAEIRLDPPELGTLHVRLQLNQDQASLSFTSPHAQVRDALEQQMPRLREMLAEQGLNLESSSVADDSERRERSRPDAGSGAGLMAEQDEDPAATVAPVVSVTRSLVDDYA